MEFKEETGNTKRIITLSPARMLLALFLGPIITNSFGLSPEEFQQFYDPQPQYLPRPHHHNRPHYQNRPEFSNRPPQFSNRPPQFSNRPQFPNRPHQNSHFPFQNPNTPHSPNTFNQNRDPYPTRRPFQHTDNSYHVVNTKHPSVDRVTRRPFRPVPFNHQQNKYVPEGISLVKLRKLYSQTSSNKKKRPTVPSNHPYAIPPEYIRTPPQSNHFTHTSYYSPHLPRPLWSLYREGRKKQNELRTYMGPNNQSVFFEKRIQAIVGVDDEYDFSQDDPQEGSSTNFHTLEINRPKRYSLQHAFNSGYLGKECTTKDGEKGQCLTSPQCHMNRGTSKFSKECTFGACCTYFIKSCGTTIRSNNTIWQIPDANGTQRIGSACSLRIEKLLSSICQLRLDFIKLQLKGPNNGTCLEDKLLVTGQNINSVIPQLCGNVTGDHLYIDVDNSSGPVELSLINVGSDFKRDWKIKITQVECNNPNRSPKNCLQYFTGTSGTFGSFNRQNTVKQYLNNMNYAVCLRKGVGYCSVQYKVSPNFQFNFVNQEKGVDTVPDRSAGVGAIDCPDDYLVVAGNRLCGDRFNDGSLPSMSENTNVNDNTNGPFIIQVNSDASHVGEGFQLYYQQLPC